MPLFVSAMSGEFFLRKRLLEMPDYGNMKHDVLLCHVPQGAAAPPLRSKFHNPAGPPSHALLRKSMRSRRRRSEVESIDLMDSLMQSHAHVFRALAWIELEKSRMNIQAWKFRVCLAACIAAVVGAIVPAVGVAQTPDRITIVVPYPPGSAPDVVARLLATKMASAGSGSVIVDNRPGANAIIGSDFVAKSAPDGSTLLLVDRFTVIANPLLLKKMPYDPRTFKGISDVARVNLMLTVRSDAPYKTWPEFVSYAKAHPGEIAVGTGGIGSIHHVSMELLSRAGGIKLTHIPYKGVTPAVSDLLGGQLSGVISGPEVIKPHEPTGKLRVLLVGADQRSALFPDVPTLREAGVSSATLLPTTFTLFAPAGTPDAVVAALNSAAKRGISQPDLIAKLGELGLTATSSGTLDIRAALGKLQPQLETVIRDAQIALD